MKKSELRQLIREEIENVLNENLSPIEKEQVLGLVKAKKRQEELIKQERENIRNVVKREIGYKEVSGIYANCF